MKSTRLGNACSGRGPVPLPPLEDDPGQGRDLACCLQGQFSIYPTVKNMKC